VPSVKRRWVVAAVAAATCLAGGLVWRQVTPAPPPSRAVEAVRINVLLWQRDPVAEEPMGEETDDLIALLEPGEL
jgi:hypothetical protein